MTASARAVKCYRDSDQLVLFIQTIDENGYLAEDFVVQCFIIDFPVQVLCKDVLPDCPDAGYFTKNDDLFLDKYDLNSKKNNFIELTEINLSTGWIIGKLEMHFERDKSKPKVKLDTPDNLSFTEGIFTVKLPE